MTTEETLKRNKSYQYHNQPLQPKHSSEKVEQSILDKLKKLKDERNYLKNKVKDLEK